MEQGRFDKLSGSGRPLDLEPLPPGDDGRAMWWAMKVLRRDAAAARELRDAGDEMPGIGLSEHRSAA